ncbi:uncharacterized protein BP5553_04218 [Venustampulla echinocandica]|uniref:C2H2-type domain-containing protein n=1 Tax=Venustampulla echinocandica TaxID=2656787 RepID=A0A370TWM9_9HELO|nr:uncharacterized protein BP5553_04218 [Venustampulla echinocandica]RDL39878.1 hypothetical protein BP5553_04218 [Venustampulla echinocandica]
MAQSVPQDVQQRLLIDPSQPTLIAPKARTCLGYLEKICDTLRIITPDQAIKVGFERNTALLNFQDAIAKFQAWGVSIAAFRSEMRPMSLDFRLRDALDIRKRLCQVLEELREYLEDSTQIVSGQRVNHTWGDITSDSDSDEEGQEQSHEVANAAKSGEVESTSELQELCIAINASIVNLMKLSMLIRESSKRDDYAKAASRYNTWNPSSDIGHVQEKYGSAKESSDWMLKRLGKAITRRRQFLTYRKEHHGKLTGDWGEDIDVVEETIQEDKKPAKSIAQTQATTFVPSMIPPEEDGSDVACSFGSQTSYEATEVANEDGPTKLMVPLPPKWAFEDVPFEYGEPFQCPFCYTEQVVKNKNAWKKHVFWDLKPYVCTFQECATRMFRSRNEWFTHELQCHRREWVCQFCQHDAFPTAEMFSKHVVSKHPAILAGSKIEAVILQSEEPIARIPVNACPLCNEWETHLCDSKQDSKRLLLNDGEIVEPYGTPKQFRRHLGRHMEQLALFALPVKGSDELENESLDEQEEDDTDPGDQEDLLKPQPEGMEGFTIFSPGDPMFEAITDDGNASEFSCGTNNESKYDFKDRAQLESDIQLEIAKKQLESNRTATSETSHEDQRKLDQRDSDSEIRRLEVDLQKFKNEEADALAKAAKNPEADRRKPVKFKDAVGRKFSFPFHLCVTWAGMEDLIRQAFQNVDVVGPHVQDGHYDLIGPNGEILLPQVWETVIEPDMSITMHMWPMPEPSNRASGPPPPPPPPPAGLPGGPRGPRKVPRKGFLGWQGQKPLIPLQRRAKMGSSSTAVETSQALNDAKDIKGDIIDEDREEFDLRQDKDQEVEVKSTGNRAVKSDFPYIEEVIWSPNITLQSPILNNIKQPFLKQIERVVASLVVRSYFSEAAAVLYSAAGML